MTKLQDLGPLLHGTLRHRAGSRSIRKALLVTGLLDCQRLSGRRRYVVCETKENRPDVSRSRALSGQGYNPASSSAKQLPTSDFHWVLVSHFSSRPYAKLKVQSSDIIDHHESTVISIITPRPLVILSLQFERVYACTKRLSNSNCDVRTPSEPELLSLYR
jgi:hypothetical protein